MNRIFKTAVLSAAVVATTLATLPAANAGDWRLHGHHGDGDAVAAGVLGPAAGALIVGALTNDRPPPRDYYYGDYYHRHVRVRQAPVRRYYAQPQVFYAYRCAEPWTRDWYVYCSDRYRSFNARTGTFTGNDGEQHFCTAN
ncbi:BA14K family protein [Mesorhizobium sp. ArgA1]